MIGFLLDTNVLSELVRPRPEAKLVAWIESTEESLMYLSVLTLGEIRKGIDLLEDDRRRVQLEAWLESDLIFRFAGRILSIDVEVADRWGRIAARIGRGMQIPVIDGLLAATALHYNLTLATRNTKDVFRTGASVFNPWDGTPQ